MGVICLSEIRSNGMFNQVFVNTARVKIDFDVRNALRMLLLRTTIWYYYLIISRILYIMCRESILKFRVIFFNVYLILFFEYCYFDLLGFILIFYSLVS